MARPHQLSFLPLLVTSIVVGPLAHAAARESSPCQATDPLRPEAAPIVQGYGDAREMESAGTGREGAVGAGVQPTSWSWPCRLLVAEDLREFAKLAWDHSVTFRKQCRKLEAARAVVIVQSSQQTSQAEARIGISCEGVMVARVRVRRSANAVELIAHELEHVLERLEGVNFLLGAQLRGSGISLSGGTFETTRAIDAGRRVAREVRVETRSHVYGR